jgi:hypothetical protein
MSVSVLSRFRMGGGGERTAAATNRRGATCGIIVYFRRRGRTAALAGALSRNAWPKCADRWHIAWNERARAFAPRSGSAKPRPERARQSKAVAPPLAPASIANALLAAISSVALVQLRAREAFIWKVVLEARWRLGNRAAHLSRRSLRRLPRIRVRVLRSSGIARQPPSWGATFPSIGFACRASILPLVSPISAGTKENNRWSIGPTAHGAQTTCAITATR